MEQTGSQRVGARSRGGDRTTVGALFLATASAVAVGTAVVMPPAALEHSPMICPFLLLTGLPCPACGLTRSWVALGHGDVADAFAFNAFGPPLMAVSAAFVVWVVVARVRGRPLTLPGWSVRVAVVVGVLWASYAVVRFGAGIADYPLFAGWRRGYP